MFHFYTPQNTRGFLTFSGGMEMVDWRERDQEPVNTCSELEIKSTRILCGTQHKKCKDFSSKYGQIRRFLRVWLHLLKKSLMEIKKLIEGTPSTKPPSAKA